MTKLTADIRPITRKGRLIYEQLRRQKYKNYRLDPLLWAEEVLGESRANFEWSLHGEAYEHHIWDGSKDPLSNAWRTITNPKESLHIEGVEIPKNWVAVSAATGTSKTYWAARLAMWYLDCFENCLIVTSAPKESQLSINLWSELSRIKGKLKKVRPYLQDNKLRYRAEGNSPHEIDTKESHEMIGFVAGVAAGEDSATKAQGFHRENMLIICEEMAGMNPAIVKAFINTCTASTNIIVGLGNPDSEHDELHKFSLMARVQPFRISALDFPNVVLKKEIYPGAASVISIAARKQDFGEDSPMYKSRVRGITPSDSTDSVVQGLWIDECDKYSKRFHNKPHVNARNGVGVDVARSETGDMAALAWFDGNRLFNVQEFQCPSVTHLAYNLIWSDAQLISKGFKNHNTLKIKDWLITGNQIGVDVVGVGVGTVDTLIDEGYADVQGLSGGQWNEAIPMEKDKEGKEKPKYNFSALRTQMYWEFREDLRLNNIILDIPDRNMFEHIKRELTISKFKRSPGTIAIEAKDDIIKRLGKSPNVADAIVYANWVRKGYRVPAGGLPMIFG